MLSVNVNPGALVALRALNATNAQLVRTQERLATGLRVASAKDDAAEYNIAQHLRGDLAGLNSALASIDRATGAVDVALAAAETVSDLLIRLKELAVAASDPSLDTATREALNLSFIAVRDQITLAVDSAEINGVNAVEFGGDDIVAILDAQGNDTLVIAAEDLSLQSGGGGGGKGNGKGKGNGNNQSSGGTNVIIASSAELSDAATASQLVADIETSITNVGGVLSRLGAGARALDLHRAFAARISDAVEVGIGNIVDADISRELARLRALQVKRQLGAQALAIANAAPQALLRLFGQPLPTAGPIAGSERETGPAPTA